MEQTIRTYPKSVKPVPATSDLPQAVHDGVESFGYVCRVVRGVDEKHAPTHKEAKCKLRISWDLAALKKVVGDNGDFCSCRHAGLHARCRRQTDAKCKPLGARISDALMQ